MKKGILNKNFFLLLQGKVVSNIGDVLYSVALSYWILETTGSKSMMGTILAIQTLVKVILCPFGGVVSDRINRKTIVVGSDFICGCILTTISVFGLCGRLSVWMVLVAGIGMAAASAFFGPAVSAILPDLVAKEDLSKALSLNNTAITLVQILSQSISGILLSLFGPLMIFLGNGASFFLSSLSESFIQNPVQEHSNVQMTFFEDFKEGLTFVIGHRGLRTMMLLSCVLNFFGNGASVLILPYFLEKPFLQGASGYGFTMSVLTIGTLIAVMIYGFLKLNGQQRQQAFATSILISCLGISLLMASRSLWLIMVAAFVFGFGNALLNIIFSEVMYEIVPGQVRGKVMGLTSTMSMGLTPIAMAVFSYGADLIGTYLMMSFGFVMMSIGSFLLVILPAPREAIRNKPLKGGE